MTPLASIPLDDPRIAVQGALHVERSADLIRLSRLPAWTRAQSPEPAFDLMAAMTSGVRLVFATTSSIVELDMIETGLQFAGEARRRADVEIYADGNSDARSLTAGHTIVVDEAEVAFVAGRATTLRFELAAGPKRVVIWLPQSACCEISGLRLDQTALLEQASSDARVWAHYGSSISHGMEAAGPSRSWPALAARTAGVELVNLGLAGQCHLDGFVARTLRDGAFDLISLKPGVNVVASDTFRRRTFANAVHSFLDTIREGCPTTPLLVISPTFCPLIEDEPGPVRRIPGGTYLREARSHAREDGALCLADVRRILSDVVERRRGSGDGALFLLDGLSLLGATDAYSLTDKLHPGAEGHEKIARRMVERAFGKGCAFGGA